VPPTQPSVTPPPSRRQAGSASTAPPPGFSGAELEELTDAFVTSARALVAMALRSVNASPVEVTLMQHRVLVLLASRGEQSVSMLAEHLGVNASNASRVCDRLQRLGLLARRRSTTDARSVKVAVTGDGMDVVRSVDEHRRAEVRGLLGSLSPEAGSHVVQALRTFNEAAHESAQQDWVVTGPAQ